MSNPQLENGYTRIANEIMEALYRMNLSAYETRTLLFILRRTYGFQKKIDRLTLSQFSKAMGIDRRLVHRALHSLASRNIIVISRDDRKRVTYGFQKNYERWKLSSVEMTRKRVSSAEMTKVSSVEMTAPLKKEKERVNIYTAIFNTWNEQHIVVHRDIRRFIPYIKSKLNPSNGGPRYTVEEITAAIKNYATILKSDNHFFSYRWSLDEFLSRKGGLDKFLTVNDPFNNFRNKGSRTDGDVEMRDGYGRKVTVL